MMSDVQANAHGAEPPQSEAFVNCEKTWTAITCAPFTCQPRQYVSSRRRHVPSLHGDGTTSEPTFWNVHAAGESHLDDDASASFTKDTLPHLGQNHAVGRIGRRQRGPHPRTEQKNENWEERAA